MRGTTPKPVEVRRREGNPGKRPLPATVLVAGRPARVGELEPPDDLPAEALDFWWDTAAHLWAAGIVDRVDRPALVAMSVQWARAERARKVIASEGFFALGSMGQIVEHPALGIERAAVALFLRLAEQYALTPVARTRLGLAALQARSMQEDLAASLGPNPRG